jgi:CubicO group peptidase (beta-lactamase class C family)
MTDIDPERIDALFSQWKNQASPGCVVAIIQDNEIIFERAYGMADLERHAPLNVRSVLDLGSTGKQFTAMTLAILAKKGILSLDDLVQKYIPELPTYNHPIYIHHLLYHTSGLRDYTALMDLAGWRMENYYPEDEILDLVCRQATLNFIPGDEFVYSNSGYFLLGVIAQRATGKPLRDLLSEFILDPLGMKSTATNDDVTRIVKDRAISYSPSPDGGFVTEISPSTGFGDGPILSTVEDLFRWDRNFYHNQLDGGQEIINQMVTSGQLNSGLETGYGLGLFLGNYRGLKTVSHGGGWAGYRAEMVRFPDQRFSVICLSNAANILSPISIKQIADLYLVNEIIEPSMKFPAEPGELNTVTNGNLEKLTGFYRHQITGGLMEISIKDDQLVATIFGRRMRLAALGEMRFHTPEKPYWYHFDFQGSDGDILLGVTSEIFSPVPDQYKRIDSLMGTPLSWSEYNGTYYSKELEIKYTITQKGEQLILKKDYFPPVIMKAVGTDLFTCQGFDVSFQRSHPGQVISFKVQDSRVRNVLFCRSN